MTVNNVAPTPALSDPGAVLATQVVNFTASATDQSQDDLAAGFAYSIDWGDGSPLESMARTAGNGSGVSLSHAFAAVGTYTVTLSATDKDGGTASVTRTVTILAVTATDLQTMLSQQGSISVQAATDAEAQSLVSAVNALPAQATPVPIR